MILCSFLSAILCDFIDKQVKNFVANRLFLQHCYHAFNIIGQPGIVFFPCKAVYPLRRNKKLSDHLRIAQFGDRVAAQKIIKKIRRKSGKQLILGPDGLALLFRKMHAPAFLRSWQEK